MKISCMKSELIRGINIVMKAVPVRTTLSIQECILVDAAPGRITLTANDMELGIETVITGTVEKRGMIALDAKLFSDIVRKLPDDLVTIESDDLMNAQIVCGKSKFIIPGLDGVDFSRVPAVSTDNEVILSQLSLRDMIRQTLFSVSASDPYRRGQGSCDTWLPGLQGRQSVFELLGRNGSNRKRQGAGTHRFHRGYHGQGSRQVEMGELLR